MLRQSMAGGLMRCRRGNALIVSAATLPLLIGSAALAYDTVQLAVWMQQLQEAADASALAGAQALAEGRPVAPAVRNAADRDGRITIIAPVTVKVAQNGTRRAVHVTLISQRSLPFLGAMLSGPPTRAAEAVATGAAPLR